MKKTNLLILPQENLYLKTDGTMYNDVKFVTCVKLKTLLHCYLAFAIFAVSYFYFYSCLKKGKFLKVEHNLGTEKE